VKAKTTKKILPIGGALLIIVSLTVVFFNGSVRTSDDGSVRLPDGSTFTPTGNIGNGQDCSVESEYSEECGSGVCAKSAPKGAFHPIHVGSARLVCMDRDKDCAKPNSAGILIGEQFINMPDRRKYYCIGDRTLGLANGSACGDQLTPGGHGCQSGRCEVGPWGENYCVEGAPGISECPIPRIYLSQDTAGVTIGQHYFFDGGEWICKENSQGVVRLAPHCKHPNVQNCGGVANGQLCESGRDCSSGHCYKGPGVDGEKFCLDGPHNCPRPGSRYATASERGTDQEPGSEYNRIRSRMGQTGINFNQTYDYMGKTWKCQSGGVGIVEVGPLDHKGYGANTQVCGSNPIGGGPGYSATVTERNADHVVRSLSELQTALACSHCTIFIPGDVELNFLDLGTPLVIANDGVTLASDRGTGPGALFYFDKNQIDKSPGIQNLLIRITGEDVRVTGLRIKGTNHHVFSHGHQRSYEYGIKVVSKNVEIDNNELSNFSGYSVYLEGPGTLGGRVHHNNIHHNLRLGTGYGVMVGGNASPEAGIARIYANTTSWGRHFTAGTGSDNTFYWADCNIVDGFWEGYPFDLHYGGDQAWMSARNNSVYAYSGLGGFHLDGFLHETPGSLIARNYFGAYGNSYGCSDPSLRETNQPGCGVSQVLREKGLGRYTSSGPTTFMGFVGITSKDNLYMKHNSCINSSHCDYDWECGGFKCHQNQCNCEQNSTSPVIDWPEDSTTQNSGGSIIEQAEKGNQLWLGGGNRYQNVVVAQGFRVVSEGSLRAIEVELRSVDGSSDDQIILELADRNWDVIESSNLSGFGRGLERLRFEFSGSSDLLENSEYRFIVRLNNSQNHYVIQATGDVYDGGSVYSMYQSRGPNFFAKNFDLTFKIELD
jgi:hypothetical protein